MTGPGPSLVADVVARSFGDRPLFCDLLAQQEPLNLERNVSPEAVRAYKLISLAAVGEAAGVVRRALPDLTERECLEFISAIASLAGNVWQIANPGSRRWRRCSRPTRPWRTRASTSSPDCGGRGKSCSPGSSRVARATNNGREPAPGYLPAATALSSSSDSVMSRARSGPSGSAIQPAKAILKTARPASAVSEAAGSLTPRRRSASATAAATVASLTSSRSRRSGWAAMMADRHPDAVLVRREHGGRCVQRPGDGVDRRGGIGARRPRRRRRDPRSPPRPRTGPRAYPRSSGRRSVP